MPESMSESFGILCYYLGNFPYQPNIFNTNFQHDLVTREGTFLIVLKLVFPTLTSSAFFLNQCS